jgi:hypothetical protein
MKRSMETEKYVFVKMMGTKQLFAVRFVCSKSKYLYYCFGVGGEDTFFNIGLELVVNTLFRYII